MEFVASCIWDAFSDIFGIITNVIHVLSNLFFAPRPKSEVQQLRDKVKGQFSIIRSQQDKNSWQTGVIQAQNSEIKRLKDLLAEKDKEIKRLNDIIRSLEIQQFQKTNHR
jgi:hypothetical protein